MTTGDNHNGPLPQDLTRLGGKVLRVDRNGAAAPGNSTPSGGDPRIYTYGHRNVQGIDFRPVGTVNAGQAYTGKHGPNHSDEVTPLVAGGNAGCGSAEPSYAHVRRRLLRLCGQSDDDADVRHHTIPDRNPTSVGP